MPVSQPTNSRGSQIKQLTILKDALRIVSLSAFQEISINQVFQIISTPHVNQSSQQIGQNNWFFTISNAIRMAIHQKPFQLLLENFNPPPPQKKAKKKKKTDE